ncbi:DUF4432 family protein [Aeromonas caviae]
MKITLSPTRGMGIKEVSAADLRLGWDSPVKEVVNPAFIDSGEPRRARLARWLQRDVSALWLRVDRSPGSG